MKQSAMVELRRPLNWLLAAVPIAVVLNLKHAGPVWIFAVACLAIIPLAGFMGRATEHLSEQVGPGLGAFLNASLGNAAELIIALMLISRGPSMYPLVKASLTGSIIGNVLLVLGLSIVAGGVKFKIQKFNRTAASMGATMMALAGIALVVPTIFSFLHVNATGVLHSLSEEIAAILLVIYVLSLFFSMSTHKHLFSPRDEASEGGDVVTADGEHWKLSSSIWVLLASTAGVAFMSEIMISSVEHAATSMGMTQVFVGVIVVAIVGNAAEHSTAVFMAMKNKMDLSINIAVGSSIQIALFVAPVLVFASMIMNGGSPLDLHFTAFEAVSILFSVFVLALVSSDGETHWMEGVMLLGVYIILALAFFHLPESITAHH